MVCTDQGTAALKVGQHVNIQNQRGAGKVARRWDRTGVVVEDLGYNKYRVRIDGSGRVTDRNRQFLRLFKPATTTYSPGITKTTREDISHPLAADGEFSVDPQVTAPEVFLRSEIIPSLSTGGTQPAASWHRGDSRHPDTACGLQPSTSGRTHTGSRATSTHTSCGFRAGTRAPRPA